MSIQSSQEHMRVKLLFVNLIHVSKCIAKAMYLEKPKSLIVWNGGSTVVLQILWEKKVWNYVNTWNVINLEEIYNKTSQIWVYQPKLPRHNSMPHMLSCPKFRNHLVNCTLKCTLFSFLSVYKTIYYNDGHIKIKLPNLSLKYFIALFWINSSYFKVILDNLSLNYRNWIASNHHE
jgi:hypothetical protein